MGIIAQDLKENLIKCNITNTPFLSYVNKKDNSLLVNHDLIKIKNEDDVIYSIDYS